MIMNIAIIGYGKMGHEIERIAREKGITVKAIIDPAAPGANHREVNKDSLNGIDVAIDFTQPEAAVANIRKYCSLGVNAVVGTTGWYGKLDEVKKDVQKSGIGLIWSGNFSVGVNMFFRIIKSAAKIVDKVPDYDLFAYELHHSKKADSPSGTAKMIGDILIQNIKRKKKVVTDKLDRKIEADELHFASVRGGSVPGTHVVGLDSPADTIELKHTARGRAGFAMGAVMASQWVKGKKGFFGIDEMMNEIIGE